MNTIDAALLAWSLGIVGTLLLPWLPGGWVLLGTAALGLGCLCAARASRIGSGGWLLLGLCHGVIAGQGGLGHRLPECGAGVTVTFSGRILTVSERGPASRVEVAVLDPERLSRAACPAHVRRVRLSWFAAPGPIAGEVWRFEARLKGPRGYQNRAGFDYEAWILARGIDATGYVRRAERKSRSVGFQYLRHRLRRRLYDLDLSMVGVLDALVFGATGSVAPERWDTLRRTGTVHLMVVSGLHVGLIAGFGYLLGRWLGSVPGLLRRRSARLPATIGGLSAATGYAALAGWSLPIQRAWLMAVVMLICLNLGRRVSVWRWYLLALAVVLTLHPLAPVQSGFWMSFGAVALLLAAFTPRAPRRWLSGLIAAQAVLFFGMSPLLAGAHGEVPTIAPLANLVAVPVVSALVVPAALVGGSLLAVLPSIGQVVLGWADELLRVLFWTLDRASSVAAPFSLAAAADRLQTLTGTALAMLLIGLALPPQPWFRRVLLISALSVLPATIERPAPGQFHLTVLDVGQGLAVHLRTARHDLLYDAGARYPSGFDLGESVVVPALKAVGTKHLDTLLISHADNDHQGGAESVTTLLTPTWIVAPEGGDGRCRNGSRWQWDGVTFEMWHPGNLADSIGSRNDRSCVLWVTGEGVRALLPGDIERGAEQEFVASRPGTVDVLLAPHHGSRTSSTRQFINHLRPRLVLISNGYRNRFGHPHPEVLERYDRYGVQWQSTAQGGALRWRSSQPRVVQQERSHRPPYWRAP